ncbi:hypothetical protein N7539_006745 [Penicillium diatomitis]|uniref:Stc1 domain-containing protein n=1 Tax=Penicillium diatomitis TaxID=2819901 RepID=A0A9W9X1U0_9EURO|nr:uncharacterized protein N7539_006745 [Penicillium diatomitis]KAJ5480851.1 hypothetical protein N7539_006745 [Penicillium diatomitis]
MGKSNLGKKFGKMRLHEDHHEHTDDELTNAEVIPRKVARARDGYTIRGELCVECLEMMLSDSSVACLRNSNGDKCRCCMKKGRQCMKIPTEFQSDIEKFIHANDPGRTPAARVLLSKVWDINEEARKAQQATAEGKARTSKSKA